MLMLLSPAKTLDYETPATTTYFSIPDYLGKSAELVGVVKKKTFRDLMELMQVSQKIAELSVEHFIQWRLPFTSENAKQAVLAFKGDVYTGFDWCKKIHIYCDTLLVDLSVFCGYCSFN